MFSERFALRQIALFVVPFSVLVGWAIDKPTRGASLGGGGGAGGAVSDFLSALSLSLSLARSPFQRASLEATLSPGSIPGWT